MGFGLRGGETVATRRGNVRVSKKKENSIKWSSNTKTARGLDSLPGRGKPVGKQ